MLRQALKQVKKSDCVSRVRFQEGKLISGSCPWSQKWPHGLNNRIVFGDFRHIKVRPTE